MYIFSGIMTAELWRATANVPGLIRLLSAYFARHSVRGTAVYGVPCPTYGKPGPSFPLIVF